MVSRMDKGEAELGGKPQGLSRDLRLVMSIITKKAIGQSEMRPNL